MAEGKGFWKEEEEDPRFGGLNFFGRLSYATRVDCEVKHTRAARI
jgi:hypothetical protein